MRIKRIPHTTQIETSNIVSDQPPVDLSLMDKLLDKYKNQPGNLIPILQGTQEIFGYIPRDAFLKINKETGLKLNEMYGVATFYAQFRLTPAGNTLLKCVMAPLATCRVLLP